MDSDDIEIVFENYLPGPPPKLSKLEPKRKMGHGAPGPQNGLAFRPGAERKPELGLGPAPEPDYVPGGLFPRLDKLPNEVSSELVG